MLTRIAIDGFKTFEQFTLDLGPFLLIVGPNASGKSNLFDGIRLLSRLATLDLRSAVKELRGEAQELFRRLPDGSHGNRMHLAAEVLLDPSVRDPWGAEVKLTHTRVRYEVTVERRWDEKKIERLIVSSEAATPIYNRTDRWRPAGVAPSKAFRQAFFKYGRRSPLLSTDLENDAPSFEIHQDGKAGRKRSAQAAEATVLSSITSAEFPHLFALREELRSWQFLQLDPASLRRPSSKMAPETLEPDGSNLATVLARIRAETATPEQPHGVIADIAADLAALITGITGVEIEEDERRREYRVDISVRDDVPFSSRVVSDGTLRVLALLTVMHDPRRRGLVCFEEPENGVHPGRLRALVRRLRELASDVRAQDTGEMSPLSQILLNSHSPVALSALDEADTVFADLVTTVDRQTRSMARRTRMRPVVPPTQGQLGDDDVTQGVTKFEVDQYLSTASREG